MKYHYHKPHQDIAVYVRTVLILEGCAESGMERLPMFTNGIPALVCRTEKNPDGYEDITLLSLFGKSTDPECWLVDKQTTIIAYFFKPFSLAAIFNVPVAGLMESPLDLSQWHPHKSNALRAQLIYAESTSRKVEVLDHLLIHQITGNRIACEMIQYATNQIICNSGTEILSAILKTLNIKERTFQRMFKKYVGVSATQFRRICQFQQSFAQLRAEKFDKTSDVAFDNGFADQSHFIRSFREFAATTPSDYLRKGLSGSSK